MRKLGGFLVVATLLGSALHAERDSAPSVRDTVPRAPRAIAATLVAPGSAAIQIDGEFTEEVWSTAQTVADFQQRDPHEGAAPTHQTEVRVAYDETALYVAVRAIEPDADRVRALLTRRDDNSPSD